ncbi:MAG: InlB B-repeat-containing protein [Eubacterium sp.]|nr:InlB B-repeat-containing protein [Eubacterium sp.]
MKKTFTSLLLVLAMVLTMVPQTEALSMADASPSSEAGSGLVKPGSIMVSSAEFADKTVIDAGEESDSSYIKASDSDDWYSYSNYYVYNRLDDEGKALWDAYDKLCYKLLTGTADVTNTYGSVSAFNVTAPKYYYTDVISSVSSYETMEEVALLFYYTNPQYYFLYPAFIGKDNGDEGGSISFVVYNSWADGDARAEATAQIKSTAEAVVEWASSLTSVDARVKFIHDYVASNVTYDSSAVTYDYEQSNYTQSLYSALCRGSSVCAGYSREFMFLCNAAGTDATCITSDNHEWNAVRVYDEWYYVDVTWDDAGSSVTSTSGTGSVSATSGSTSGSGIIYTYYGRDSEYFESLDSHSPEDIWDDYNLVPECGIDTESEADEPGEFEEITDRAPEPYVESVLVEEEGCTVVLATTGSDIYFTTDDATDPSVCDTKSSFGDTVSLDSIDDMSSIRAISTGDDMLDSEVGTDYDTDGIHVEYEIIYELNEGENNGANPDTYVEGTGVTLADPNLKNHTFVGWYTDAKFKNRVTSIPATSSGVITLYARWIANKGTKFSSSSGYTYQVTSTKLSHPTVKLIKCENKKKITIAPSTTLNGTKYYVTAVGAKAVKGKSKVKTIVVGSNVKKIASKAFANCKKLKKVIVLSKKLTKVNKNCLRGDIKLKTVLTAKKKARKLMKKAVKACGLSATVS